MGLYDGRQYLLELEQPVAELAAQRTELQYALTDTVESGAAAQGLRSVAHIARRLAGSDRASLMLPVTDSDELSIVSASGLPQAVATMARVRLGEPISGLVAQIQQPLLMNEADAITSHTTSCRTGSFMSVPVPLGDSVCGVLNVADPIDGRLFKVDDLAALQTFADFIARDVMLAANQQQIPKLQEMVRQLRLDIIQAREDERRRIARELHDEAGHALTAAIFHLDLEATRLLPNATDLAALLNQIRGELLDCTATLHSIAFALRPRILEDLGLSAAVRSLVEQTIASGALQVSLTIAGDVRPLGELLELAVFRTVQEGLTNILKHAGASQAWVCLSFNPDEVMVTIEDNGRGFNPRRRLGRKQSGLGLAGMRERIDALGGRLSIEGCEAVGTRLVARLPIC